MTHSHQLRRSNWQILILAVLGAVGGWISFGGRPGRPEVAASSQAALRRPTGYPQLVSIEPLPAMEGPMCEWVPASASVRLVAALQREQLTARPMAGPADTPGTTIEADRAPVRVIRDSYPTYSAIALDSNTNELYLQDENLFGYKVFNRLDNTPPAASFTEPKRAVAGIKTKMEFNCGLYIDPKTGDVYSVANDTVDRMVIFPRDAQGNVAPKRELHTPHGTYGVAADETTQEIFLTVEHTNQVVVYRKTAEGEEKPLRVLEGDRTGLEDPHGIALDVKNQWMFVDNHGNARTLQAPGSGRFEPPSITVYPLKASGDTAPLRTIHGPQTQLNWPAAMFAEPERGELYVVNDVGNSILVFRATDDGDVAPVRVIKGAKTGLKNPTGVFLDAKNREVWVSNMGNHSATVYPLTANGDVAPLRTIRSAPAGKLSLAIGNPGAVAYDEKREEILVPN